jgi:SAM-dependent methyltransferase
MATCVPATETQIKDYERLVAEAWGGPERLTELFRVSADYQRAFDDAVWGRYRGALAHTVVWVERLVPYVAQLKLFEIGCGTGSSTAAFATACESIVGFDVTEANVSLATSRLNCFRAFNARARVASFDGILSALEHEPSVGGVLLYASLEHMHVEERLAVLRCAWRKIPSGGIIVVCETPNRLCYFDPHTFRQPFVHLLPPNLAHLWLERCTNDAIRDELASIPSNDFMAAHEKMVRIGYSGVSYHEFELTVGPMIHAHIISRADDPETAEFNRPYLLEQDLLTLYLRQRTPDVHASFSMPMLYLIIRKP